MAFDMYLTVTHDGEDELVQYRCGLVTGGHASYFKLGEGGWDYSDTFVETIGGGDGGKEYDLEATKLPIGRNQLSITAGGQTVTDDGSGNLSGNGTGTVNYKTGAISVTFDSVVGGGTDIDATYKYWGTVSDEKTETPIVGTGIIGPYYGRTAYWPVAESTFSITDGTQTVTDDGAGALSGDGSGTIDYETGEFVVIWDDVTSVEMTVVYKYNGAPKRPDPSLSDLESEGDPDLYTFQKDFTTDDFTEHTGLARVDARVKLELWEGIDDGEGNQPYFFEGGIFSENDVLLAYFTFTKAEKLGSREIEFTVPMIR